VSFGEFVLDADAREVRRRDEPVLLSPKAYQLLEVLVQHSPKALSKSVLQEQLWPDTFVVEKNLVNLIAEIRDALGERATHPRFVRTVHRFGYAFRYVDADPPATRTIRGKDARFRLVWAGGRIVLSDGEYVLGRDPGLELFLDSSDVSRRHARIRIAGDDATIEDLGSRNGTFVADHRVDGSVRLVDGNSIRIGSVRLTFTAVRSRGSTQTSSRSEQ
jgi:hypothetical protein